MFIVEEGIEIKSHSKFKNSRHAEYSKVNMIILILAVLIILRLIPAKLSEENIYDQVSDRISQYLSHEGFDVSNLQIVRVKGDYINKLSIYLSNSPIYDKEQKTEYWEVRRVAKLTRVYYIITPYYGEIT